MWQHASGNVLASNSEYIAVMRVTQGTETSKYLEEKKEKSISLVVASEKERAQTSFWTGVVGPYTRSYKTIL